MTHFITLHAIAGFPVHCRADFIQQINEAREFVFWKGEGSDVTFIDGEEYRFAEPPDQIMEMVNRALGQAWIRNTKISLAPEEKS